MSADRRYGQRAGGRHAFVRTYIPARLHSTVCIAAIRHTHHSLVEGPVAGVGRRYGPRVERDRAAEVCVGAAHHLERGDGRVVGHRCHDPVEVHPLVARCGELCVMKGVGRV